MFDVYTVDPLMRAEANTQAMIEIDLAFVNDGSPAFFARRIALAMQDDLAIRWP